MARGASGARRVALLVGAITLALGLVPVAADATHVRCGDVVTQDTTLDSDLVDCPGNGVVIGASGITVDLGGHTVDGTPESGGKGIDDSAGHDEVTVRNGTVRDFFRGVDLRGTDRSLISRLTFASTSAVNLEEADGNVITRNNIAGNGVTVFVGSSHNVIEGNSISGPGTGIQLWGGLTGPAEVRGTRIERNRLTGNAVGLLIYLGAIETVASGNEVSGNSDLGVAVAGTSTLLERNTVSGNGQGIHVSGQHTRLLRNRVTGNDGDGVLAGAGNNAFGTVLEGNTASGNGDDGIDVENAQTSLARNTANDNGDFGIEAVAGVTDNGGNRAAGNGNPAQCLNVACR
jgi:parallel beta-helix repeat protein